MKKAFVLLFAIALTGNISCGVAFKLDKTVKSNRWFAVEMKPSQVKTDGSIFYSATLDNNETVSVYADAELVEDGGYYRNQLWASYGWTVGSSEIATASAYAEQPQLSTLFISIKRGVAIYIYPDSTFQIFKVIKN
tara:strand:+ start:61 stop:468 length:408 start_codon:yes stop_codon:yes gene_type:complete